MRRSRLLRSIAMLNRVHLIPSPRSMAALLASINVIVSNQRGSSDIWGNLRYPLVRYK
jgi:hypothetical protein